MNIEKFHFEVEQSLQQQGIEEGLRLRLLKLLSTAQREERRCINAALWARLLEIGKRELLRSFLFMTAEGLFDLHWHYHCPQCHNSVGNHNHLASASSEGHCESCNLTFRNELDQNVQVTFSPSQRFQPYGDPPACDGSIDIIDSYISGLDCLHMPQFREIFHGDVPSIKESLQIRSITLLFTDIKGSTALYERLGDATAYRLVRDHFEILFGVIERNHGVVVKTIGDAVMASFRQPLEAVRAALESRDEFDHFNQSEGRSEEILVKMGIHSGTTIMVNLNDRIDYFGQTVNLAARIQSFAIDNQIWISKPVRQDSEVLGYLRGKVGSLARRQVEFKGIDGAKEIYRLNPLEEKV